MICGRLGSSSECLGDWKRMSVHKVLACTSIIL